MILLNNKMESLKISIITVVKNGMPYLEEAIKSFNIQTYKNKEHIIVYSQSNDNTENYLLSLQDKKIIKDKFSTNKFGSLNLALKYSTGDYIGILHADDFFNNQNTINQVMSFLLKKKSDVLYGNIKFCSKLDINKITRIWKSNDFDRSSLKYGWMPPHTSIFARKRILEDNPYSEKYLISGDYDFILKIFLNKNYKISFLDQYLITMRTGGDSTNFKSLYKKLKEDLAISKNFFKHFILCIILKILRKLNQFF